MSGARTRESFINRLHWPDDPARLLMGCYPSHCCFQDVLPGCAPTTNATPDRDGICRLRCVWSANGLELSSPLPVRVHPAGHDDGDGGCWPLGRQEHLDGHPQARLLPPAEQDFHPEY
jgi:hypothetical protein